MGTIRLKLRDYALALPGAYEDHPWGEIVAKVGKKVFMFLGQQETSWVTVKLTDPMVREHALTLKGAEPSGYGLGRSGWVSIPIRGNASKYKLLTEFIEESYRAEETVAAAEIPLDFITLKTAANRRRKGIER